MASFRGPRVVQLPCGPGKLRLSRCVSHSGPTSLASHPPQEEPEGRTWTWDRIRRLTWRWLPNAQILHPYPDERLIVTDPR